jgi:8-oxo-dGTP pyrophosphatase MutT (NUDIX family)
MSSAVAAGILYVANGRVLLLLRADGDHAQTWGLPGGKIEPGETMEWAATREFAEETGYELDALLTYVNDDGQFVIYRVDGELFTPTLNAEHTAHQWADLNDLPEPLHPGLRPILARIGTEMTGKRRMDLNGWYEVKDNPISKVGVFPYSGRAIGHPDLDPDRMYNVYRPEEELSDPETVTSFQLVPFVDDHPAAMLGPGELDLPTVDGKPAQGVIGEQVYYSNGYLYANLKLFTDRVAQALQAGKRQVSAGFRCMYDRVAGEFNGQPYDFIQRNIRGNHVALVNAGRMGPEVAVLDHFTFSFDSEELVKMADPVKDETDAAGGESMSIAEATALIENIVPAISKLTAAFAGLTGGAAPVADKDPEPEATPVPAATDAVPGMDALEKLVKAQAAEIATLKAQGRGMDAKELFASVAARDSLYKAVSPVIGAFDASEMTADDVAVYAADKLGLKVPPVSARVAVESYLAAKPAAKSTAPGIGLDAVQGDQPSAIRKHVGAQ